VTATSRTFPRSVVFGAWPRRRTLIAVAVSLVYAALLAWNVAVLLHPPQLSLRVSVPLKGQARIGWVIPGGVLWDHGVRPGQPVLMLDGAPPGPRDAGFWHGRDLVALTTAGVTEVGAGALRQGRNTWPLLVLSPWFLLLGTLVFLRAVPRPVANAAYTLFAGAALAMTLAPSADDDNPLGAGAELVVIPLFAFAFARFFLLFPVHRLPRGRSALLAIPALVSVGLGLASELWPSVYTVIRPVNLAVLVGYLLLGALLLVRGFRATREPDVRHGLTILSLTTVISVLPFVTLSLIPRLLGFPALAPPERTILALALLPTGLSYAILRYRVLLAPLLQRWAVQGLLWCLLLAPCVAAVYALYKMPPANSLSIRRNPLPIAVLVLLLGVSFRWLHDRLLGILDRLVFRDTYDYRASIQQLMRDLSLAGDVAALGRSLPATLRRLMNLDYAVLLVHEGTGMQIRGASGSYPLPSLLSLIRTAGETPPLMRQVSLTNAQHSVLLVPLQVQEALVGYLCLGPKVTGEPFRTVDLDLLSTLGRHVATIVQNVQLTDDLQHKAHSLDVLNDRLQHAREAEREYLRAELHDESLQTALQLHRHIGASSDRSRDHEAMTSLSKALISQLRAVCTSMRPPVLDDLGLIPALESLVSEFSECTGLLIGLDVDAEDTRGMAPERELILYRAAQEALNNCSRHALSPTEVCVSLHALEDAVQLQVMDNGGGWSVPDRLDDLVLKGHLGLAGLLHRVERAGGDLTVTSQPARGTVVEVRLPVLERPA